MLSLTSATAASPLVLIVDDDVDSCEMYSACVRQAGLRVDQAYDGQEALNRALANPPDVLITDIVMPRLDGFELSRRLRTTELLRALPVIAVTARSLSDTDVERLGADGPSSVLMKPCEPIRLLAEIWRVLQPSQTARERLASLHERSLAAQGRSQVLIDQHLERREHWLALVSSRRVALLERARGEFRETLGLSLTPAEAARRWALDEESCRLLLATLVDEGFLVFRNGRFVQTGDD
jgi:two-component system cell cycle response regulator DivK